MCINTGDVNHARRPAVCIYVAAPQRRAVARIVKPCRARESLAVNQLRNGNEFNAVDRTAIATRDINLLTGYKRATADCGRSCCATEIYPAFDDDDVEGFHSVFGRSDICAANRT